MSVSSQETALSHSILTSKHLVVVLGMKEIQFLSLVNPSDFHGRCRSFPGSWDSDLSRHRGSFQPKIEKGECP
jgi:hypothetical protein